MALYIDHYVRPAGVDPRAPAHRVRYAVANGSFGPLTLVEVIREARKDVFKPMGERVYALRVLLSPEDP